MTCVHFPKRVENQVPKQPKELATSLDREKENKKVVTKIKMKNKKKIQKEIILGVSFELEHLDGLCISDVSNVSNITMLNQSTSLHEAAKSSNTSHVLQLLEQGNEP